VSITPPETNGGMVADCWAIIGGLGMKESKRLDTYTIPAPQGYCQAHDQGRVYAADRLVKGDQINEVETP